MLVRRLRSQLHADNLICIGTSATMASGGTRQDQQEVVARFASRMFATFSIAFSTYSLSSTSIIVWKRKLSASDKDYAVKGARIKCNPAVKTAADRDALRKALSNGKITCFGKTVDEKTLRIFFPEKFDDEK